MLRHNMDMDSSSK